MNNKKIYLENYLLTFCIFKDVGQTELNITCFSHPAGQPLLMYQCKKMINRKYKIQAFQKWIDDLSFTVQPSLKQICFSYEYFDAGEIKIRFEQLQCSQINVAQPNNQLKRQMNSQEKNKNVKNLKLNFQQQQRNLIQNKGKTQERIQSITQNLKIQLKSQNLNKKPNSQSLKIQSESQSLKIQQKSYKIQEKSQNSKISQKQQKKPQNTQIKKQNKRKDYQKKQFKLQKPFQLPKQLKQPNTFKKKQFTQKQFLQQMERNYQMGYTKPINDKQQLGMQELLEQINTSDQQQEKKEYQNQPQQQEQIQTQQNLQDKTYMDLPEYQTPKQNQEQLDKMQQVQENMLSQIKNENQEDCYEMKMKSSQQVSQILFSIQIDDHQKFKSCYTINNNLIKVNQRDSKNVFPIIGKLHATPNQLNKQFNTFTVTLKNIPNKQFSIGWIKLTPIEHSYLIENCPQPQNVKYKQKVYFLNSPSRKIFFGEKKQYQNQMIKYEKGWSVQCKIIFCKNNENQIQWIYYDSTKSEKGSISINFEIQKDKKVYYYPYFLAKYCNSQFEIKKQG